MVKLGEIVRAKRVEKNMTQAELADKVGWNTSQYVSNIERNAANPPINMVKKLCKILDMSPVDVFTLIRDAELERVRAKYEPYIGSK